MFKKIKNKQKLLPIFFQIILIYLSFWFLLNNLKTDGIWETLILNVLLFGVLSKLLLKNKQKSSIKETSNKKQVLFFKIKIVILWLIFIGLIFSFKEATFLKLNYLARVDWYLGDWWLIFILNLFILPVILYCQELFFRRYLFEQLRGVFEIKRLLVFQAFLFVVFEVLFFGLYVWQFVLFNFILALVLGYFYYKTKSIWYPIFIRWGFILILDGVILYKIQQLKF